MSQLMGSIRRRDAAPLFLNQIRRFGLDNDKTSVVQIGANDGFTDDPIHTYVKAFEWRSLLVEPLPAVFHTLSETYEGYPNVSLKNVAISAGDDSLTLYYVNPELIDADPNDWNNKYRAWVLEYTSTSRDHLIEHYIQEEDILCVTVPAVTLPTLLTDTNTIDIFICDAEGFDYKILSQLDVERFRPRLIQYEYFHLPTAEVGMAFEFLEQNGYSYCWTDWNVLAHRP